MSSSTQRIVKHSTIYAIGNILRQIASFIMLPIYTHFLSPADYGVVGLLTFAMSIAEAFFGARLGEAMPKYYFQEDSPRRKNAVISTAFIITAASSAIAAFVLYLFKTETSSLLFGSDKYALIVGLFGIMMLTQPIESYGMTYIRIMQRPVLFIGMSLTKLVLQLALNIGLIVGLKLGVLGVVISGLVASGTYAVVLTVFTTSKTGGHFDWGIGKSMLNFCWPLWFVGLASIYIYSSNRYYIRVFSSLSDVGLYELAAKFGMILVLVAWQPFNQFWETERFNLYRQENSQRIFSTVFQFLGLVLSIAAICIGVTAEPVIRIMSSSEFHKAYLAVPILTMAFLLGSFTNFANFSFMVTDKTKIISYLSYVTVAVVSILNLALIPTYGFVGAAIALTGAMLVQFLLSFYKGRALYDMGIDLRLTLIYLSITSVVFILGALVVRSDNIWLDIALKAALLIPSLAILLFVFWRNAADQSYVRELLHPLWKRLPSSRTFKA